MDILKNFDRLTPTEIKELLQALGRASKSLKASDALLQLKIRVLADARHFELFILGLSGSNTEIMTRVRQLLPSSYPYNAVGLPSLKANRPYFEVGSQHLFDMMVHPTSFDDYLLTLVPAGTYEAENIYGALVERFYHRSFRDYVTPAAMEIYQLLMDHIKGMPIEVPPHLEFVAEWVEDVGRSGTAYSRVSFTIPADNTIWSTPPFGLLYPRPILQAKGDVLLSELQQLKEWAKLASVDAWSPQNVALLRQHSGLIFEVPDPTSWLQVTNLREAIDRLGIEGIVAPLFGRIPYVAPPVIEAVSGMRDLYACQAHGKTFVIMGDWHTDTTEGDCQPSPNNNNMSIVEFISGLIRKTKVDVFMETPHIHRSRAGFTSTYGGSTNMGAIEKLFAVCLNPDKTLCRVMFPHARFHYVDIRRIAAGNIWIDNFLSFADFRKSIEEAQKRLPWYAFMTYEALTAYVDAYPHGIDLAAWYARYIEPHATPELHQKMITQAFEFTHPDVYAKYLRQINTSLLRDEILAFYDATIAQYKVDGILHEYQGLYKKLVTSLVTANPESKALLVRMRNILNSLDVLLMDVYVLARIFKPSLQDSNMVIIHVGSAHADNYVRFLKLQGFHIDAGHKLSATCVQIPEMLKPFLS